jgi:hypothetical protein
MRTPSIFAVALGLTCTGAVSASAGGVLLPGPMSSRQAVSDIAVLPACSDGLQYACFFDPYGTRNCGCWRGGLTPACAWGYHYACPLVVNGRPQCACY